MSAGADAAAAAYDSVADGEAESRRHMQACRASLFALESDKVFKLQDASCSFLFCSPELQSGHDRIAVLLAGCCLTPLMSRVSSY